MIPSFLPFCLVVAFAPLSPAEQAWKQGDSALEQDRIEDAIAHFRRSVQLNPSLARAHLSLAAAHAALGKDEEALRDLERYLALRPGHVLVRYHYAEMLLQQHRASEARTQMERVSSELQDDDRLSRHLVACHTKLMEISARLGDRYGEHLNRGIGLYHLARRQPTPDEVLLIKAATELTLAQRRRPSEARPCLYLHNVWVGLGQRQPADRWLRTALEAAQPGALTPAEWRVLHLAGGERGHR